MLATSLAWFAMICIVYAMENGPAKEVYPSVANRWPEWKHHVEGKRVGLVLHQSSTVRGRLLADVMLEDGIQVQALFVPEHGLRGEADAGAQVADTLDPKTSLPVYSLYGQRKAPTPQQLQDLDLLVFDLQDVGVRFYTYLSTLHYVMQACAMAGIPLLVLDRPNVNDYTVDGPVLDTAYRSFVGLHPIPVLHGMTLGELAGMIKGQGWIAQAESLRLTVLPMSGYRKGLRLQPERPPSPNLRDSIAMAWYPTLCFFEACPVSVGRGTAQPFGLVGSPWYRNGDTCFVPRPLKGRSQNPVLNGRICCGFRMDRWAQGPLDGPGIHLPLLNEFWMAFEKSYRESPLTNSTNGESKSKTKGLKRSSAEVFFQPFFDKLAGGPALRLQLQKHTSVRKIRRSWQPALQRFESQRQPYLLYPNPLTP